MVGKLKLEGRALIGTKKTTAESIFSFNIFILLWILSFNENLRVVLSYVGDVGNSVLSKKFHYNTKCRHKYHHYVKGSRLILAHTFSLRVLSNYE